MNWLPITTLILLLLTLNSIKSQNLNGFEKNSNNDQLECHYENVTTGDLRIMTFNIWFNGKKVDNGINKIAKHINTINPDVACLQEVATLHCLDKTLEAVGETWSAIAKPSIYSDVAIMTKHKILDETFIAGKFIGAAIETNNGRKIRIVNGHLQYKTFGTYPALNKLVTNASQFTDGEMSPQNYSMFFGIAIKHYRRIIQAE